MHTLMTPNCGLNGVGIILFYVASRDVDLDISGGDAGLQTMEGIFRLYIYIPIYILHVSRTYWHLVLEKHTACKLCR